MELILKPDGESGELDHTTFEVDDVDIAFERLKSQVWWSVTSQLMLVKGISNSKKSILAVAEWHICLRRISSKFSSLSTIKKDTI